MTTTIHHGALALAVALLASLVAGCPVERTPEIALVMRSGAPATRTAQLVHDDPMTQENSLTLSLGMAVNVGCWDNCKYTCDAPQYSVSAPEIIDIRAINALSGNTTPTNRVLIALAPGTATLTVSNACATHTYDVTVLDD